MNMYMECAQGMQGFAGKIIKYNVSKVCCDNCPYIRGENGENGECQKYKNNDCPVKDVLDIFIVNYKE